MAAIKLGDTGNVAIKVQGAYCGLLQDVLPGEISAATMALRPGCPPLEIVSDCQICVDGFHRGEEWGTAVDAAYADTRVEFWGAARDSRSSRSDGSLPIQPRRRCSEARSATLIDWGMERLMKRLARLPAGIQCHLKSFGERRTLKRC